MLWNDSSFHVPKKLQFIIMGFNKWEYWVFGQSHIYFWKK